jgi:tellurite resistance-related uncharacterized protein
MHSTVVGFHLDEAGAWVAELSCGHAQHIRHDPPWQERAWVTTEAGRSSKLGAELDCSYCNMAVIPIGAVAYKRTPSFTEQTTPAGLLRDHRTKAGVWARVVVEEGKLEYVCGRGGFVLQPGIIGIVEPEMPHHVRALGRVRFHVVFMREA